MNRIIFFTIFLFATKASFSQVDPSQLILRIDSISKARDKAICYDKGLLYDLSITIKNEGTDSTGFWLMSCSKSEYFFIEHNFLSFCGEECDKNLPNFHKLSPGGEMSFSLRLIKKPATSIKPAKLGLAWFREREYPIVFFDSDLAEKKKNNEVIWSKEFEVH